MILLREIGSPQGLRRILDWTRAEESKRFRGGAPARKRHFAERLMIEAERHQPLVMRRIRQIYETAEAQEAISRHVDLRNNLIKRLGDKVAIAYDTPPLRHVRDVEEGTLRALWREYKTARTDVVAPQWGRYAWLVNVVHVLPRYEAEGLRWITVLPHSADVVFDPAGEDKPSILVYETSSMGAALVAVDAERWWWIDSNWRLIADEGHGIGRRPWSVFRASAPPHDDYWDRGTRAAHVDATLELVRLSAHMGWARKIGSRNPAYLFVGEDAEIPPGQLMNGEQPLMGRGDNIEIGVLELQTDVGPFRDEQATIYEDAAAAEGVPVAMIDDRHNSANPVQDYEALKKKRNKQIVHFVHAETENMANAAELLRVNGHPGGIEAGLVLEQARIKFGELTYADHPRERVQTTRERMKLGETDPYEHYMRENPGTTPQQAREEVDEHVAASADFWATLAARNMPADMAAQSLAEAQGQRGGRMAQNDDSQPGGVNDDGRDDERAAASA